MLNVTQLNIFNLINYNVFTLAAPNFHTHMSYVLALIGVLVLAAFKYSQKSGGLCFDGLM